MNPIEAKVIAAIAGGGLGGAIGQFLLWLLGVLVWHASSTADKATAATAAVPGPVSMLLVALIAAGGAGLAGYCAPHTSRPPVTITDPWTAAGAPTPVAPSVNGMSTGGNSTLAVPPQPSLATAAATAVGPPAA